MPLRLIDTHAHLDFDEFDDDREEVISRAFKVGVEKIINIGSDESHFKSSLELAAGHDNIYATIGVHPHEALAVYSSKKGGSFEDNLQQVVRRIDDFVMYKELVGIGEIGLDFFRIAVGEESGSHSIKELQTGLFKVQIEVALKADLPIVIHSREAYEEILNILNEYKSKGNLRGVVHSFEGDFTTASRFLELGFKISYNGIITYERSRDALVAIKKIPLTELMLETDSPYLTPEPLRGQRNEPACVEYVARKIGALRGIPVEEVAEQTTSNAIKLFKL